MIEHTIIKTECLTYKPAATIDDSLYRNTTPFLQNIAITKRRRQSSKNKNLHIASNSSVKNDEDGSNGNSIVESNNAPAKKFTPPYQLVLAQVKRPPDRHNNIAYYGADFTQGHTPPYRQPNYTDQPPSYFNSQFIQSR